MTDQFKGDWEAYFTKIEQSSPRIVALGVTDYFCIRTYKELLKRRGSRLPDVKLLFPNVELRLEIKTAKQHGINLHLLFSPDDSQHEYEIERILGQLRFWFQDRNYACNEHELMALGRAYDPQQKDPLGALKTGANMFKVSFPELQQLFREERKWLSKNCLVAVAGSLNDGTAGLQEDSSFAALRQEVESFADIIFASTPSQREYWLGQSSRADKETIEARYKALKPCMHGSDAHWVEKVGTPAESRYCWLKGDLSFETLQQVVLEPEYRVVIGPTPPPGPSPGETMASVSLTKAPFVTTPALLINPGLVAIIGARGSGKTALMEFLAAGADALTSTATNSSFLQRAGELLGNAKVNITWADGETKSAELYDPFSWGDNEPEAAGVCYLSQQFVERLCSAEGLATELRREMERVVFEATDQADRMQCDSFADLSAVLLRPAAEAREELERSIEAVGESFLAEDQVREQVLTQAKNIEAQKSQLLKSRGEMKGILPRDKEAHANNLAALEAAFSKSESKIEGLRLRRRTLVDLQTDVRQTVHSREPTRYRDLQSRFHGAGLTTEQWDAFRMLFKGNVESVIGNALQELDSEIQSAVKGDGSISIQASEEQLPTLPLEQLRNLRDQSKATVGIDAQKQRKYEELQRTISQLETTISRLEAEHIHAKGAAARMKELQQQRRQEYAAVFGTFSEEETTLSGLYGPLRKTLEEAGGALSKLELVVKRSVDLDGWVRRGESLLDLRRESQFRGQGSLRSQASRYLLSPWSTGGAADVAQAMDDFRAMFQEDFKKALPAFATQDERRTRVKEITGWLYSTGHIKVQYGITYEGTPIERLSPGTRGIVLLLLYLAVDTHDRRPLFIDQPEENLDPRSVFKELVPHFRSAKQRRQVVMVTHNANLVVNTDADQIIVATSKRNADGGLPIITYQSGSIENSEIREAVCRLLEGGRRAFLDRERRYRIRPGEVVPEDQEQ